MPRGTAFPPPGIGPASPAEALPGTDTSNATTSVAASTTPVRLLVRVCGRMGPAPGPDPLESLVRQGSLDVRGFAIGRVSDIARGESMV
jgi:hypothetical protein